MTYNVDKREAEYPAELESQFVLRLPEEPAKALKEVLSSGDNLKNRLTIKIENDMRHGEVQFDHWHMHSKIVDIPTIIETLKTFDKKSFYKTADLCQMMICKEEPDQTTTDEETPSKNKKKDANKVDKKFLWPHGITPPTKNVRKRRFRKTLKKKCVEAPEIEKELKRLLRADNEAISVTWEIIKEEDDSKFVLDTTPVNVKLDKKRKSQSNQNKDHVSKRESLNAAPKSQSSNVVDIFGGAVSDSDLEDDNLNVDLEQCHLGYDNFSKDTSIQGMAELSNKRDLFTDDFNTHIMFTSQKMPVSHTVTSATLGQSRCGGLSSEDDLDYPSHDMSKENMTLRIQQSKSELEELKQRRQRTQLEIAGLENMALRQRFEDILHTLNQDIMYKEMEYQGMLTLQNSEII